MLQVVKIPADSRDRKAEHFSLWIALVSEPGQLPIIFFRVPNYKILLMDKILHDPKEPINYGNYGIFLIMGNKVIFHQQ